VLAMNGTRRDAEAKAGWQARSQVKIVIVDDCARSRSSLRALLATSPRIEVVGEAPNGQEAIPLIERCLPDTVLMDVLMPTLDGIEATRVLKRHWPRIKVVVLSMYDVMRAEALAAGADAFLVKGCSPEELMQIVLHAGEPDQSD